MIDLSNQNVGRNAEISTLSRYQKTLEERSETLKDEFEGRDKAEAANRANLEKLEAEITENGKVLESEKEKIFEFANKIISVNKHITELSDEIAELTDKSARAAARRRFMVFIVYSSATFECSFITSCTNAECALLNSETLTPNMSASVINSFLYPIKTSSLLCGY